jgi:3-isopropylmalate dehydrogenase
MILAAKMMLDWLGARYDDSKCLKAANAIENGVVAALQSGQAVPDCGGKLTTSEMAKAIAKALK